jgi:hypothetical protein
MKKVFWILCILWLYFGEVALAADNYLQLRYGINVDTKAQEKYIIFENSSIKDWVLGSKLIVGDKKFILINPYVYYGLPGGLQIGARFLHDSVGNDLIAPGIRYFRVFGKLFFCLDAAQYLDTKGSKHKTDIWMHLSTADLGWYYGFEIWYYHVFSGSQNINFRPVKIGYRFENGLAPFIMYEHHWDNFGKQFNSIYSGIEFKF